MLQIYNFLNMKVLFIGGTGNISSSVSKQAVSKGIDLYHLNRGKTGRKIDGVTTLKADIEDKDAVKEAIRGYQWDAVVNWIVYKPETARQDIDLFRGKTGQYIFISSASVYQKPLLHPVITEATPLRNPYWQYSRDKIACEELLMECYQEFDFPVTIVRPSHTYDTIIPAAISCADDYTLIDRIKKGKNVILHGDGESLWTLTHAEDFAKGFVGLLGNQQAIGHAFHITGDEILTWNQIYRIIGSAVGKSPEIIHIASDFICEIADKRGITEMRGMLLGDKAISAIYDNTKIKRFVPEFAATISFTKGIQQTLSWFEQNTERQKMLAVNQQLHDAILDAYMVG